MKLHFLKIICKSMSEKKKGVLKNSTDINFSVLLKHKFTVASFNDMTQQHNTGKVHNSLCLKIGVMWQGVVNKNREAIRTWIHTSLENMFQRSWYRRCLASNRLTNTLASSSCRWNKEIWYISLTCKTIAVQKEVFKKRIKYLHSYKPLKL